MIILKSEWYNYQLSSLSFENVFVIYECDLCRKARTICHHLRKGYVFHSHDPDFPSICFRSLAQWGPPHSATCCCGGVTGIQEVYAFLTSEHQQQEGSSMWSYNKLDRHSSIQSLRKGVVLLNNLQGNFNGNIFFMFWKMFSPCCSKRENIKLCYWDLIFLFCNFRPLS